MAPKASAAEALERVLQILPIASREGGATLDDLARALDVPVDRVLADLAEVTARGDYLLPPLDIDILIDGDRVTVWTLGEHRRPVRLSPLEALALAIGLRVLADEQAADRRDELRSLADRLDRGIASIPAGELAARYELDSGDPAGGGLLAMLRDAADARRPVGLLYLKPAGSLPEGRRVRPYALVFGSGRWYLLGWSAESKEVRAFRLDRIAEARALEGRFDVPPDFDPREYVTDSAVYRADEERVVTIRYSARIARWILEWSRPDGADREGGEDGGPEVRPDGSVVVRHRVADPTWALRHVLVYGPEAEVLEPPEIRALVRERAEAMAR